MTVFLNGEFVGEEAATVSVFDRGFLYGDGLFETILIWNSKDRNETAVSPWTPCFQVPEIWNRTCSRRAKGKS